MPLSTLWILCTWPALAPDATSSAIHACSAAWSTRARGVLPQRGRMWTLRTDSYRARVDGFKSTLVDSRSSACAPTVTRPAAGSM